MQDSENEQAYHDLLLGDHAMSLSPNEIGVCVKCLNDIKHVDDYVTNIIFTKSGNSAKTHTEYYHLKCWKK